MEVLMANQVVWFDIPALDLERAIRFYSRVLNIAVTQEDLGMPMGVFAHEGPGVSGCVFVDEANKPSAEGPLLYFNVNGRLDEAVAAATENGGKVVMPRHSIGPYGHRAIVLDSEGNRIALHSES
jgi:predicted enzyme related to lactoylglutathione lyase